MAPRLRRGFDLFRLAGIQVAVDPSWFVVFLLVAWSLVAGYFPHTYPGFGWGSYLVVGLATTLVFFASVLAHEFSHAMVANRLGQEVRRIVLFVFGGVAELSGEPRSPEVELKVAAVGPLASLLLAAIFWSLSVPVRGGGTAVLWRGMFQHLALVNLVLAVFNLLPGFPLDGGRLLRAILWRRSGNLRAATARAAGWGSGIAGILMVLGVVEIFSGMLVGGLWLIFIGMFLRGSADASYEQVLVEQVLGGMAVADYMVQRPVTLGPDATIAQAIDTFLRHGYAGFPVCRDGEVEGLLSLADVRRCPAAERDRRRVGEFMRPATPDLCVRKAATLRQALGQMARADAGRLLVMDDGHLAGLVTRSGIARLVTFQTELDRA